VLTTIVLVFDLGISFRKVCLKKTSGKTRELYVHDCIGTLALVVDEKGAWDRRSPFFNARNGVPLLAARKYRRHFVFFRKFFQQAIICVDWSKSHHRFYRALATSVLPLKPPRACVRPVVLNLFSWCAVRAIRCLSSNPWL